MGTHPIFESDFDCLTECLKIRLKNLRVCRGLILSIRQKKIRMSKIFVRMKNFRSNWDSKPSRKLSKIGKLELSGSIVLTIWEKLTKNSTLFSLTGSYTRFLRAKNQFQEPQLRFISTLKSPKLSRKASQ